MGLGELPDPGPGEAALGDWYAHLLTIERQPLVLAVSEKTLLAVALPARDLKNLARHFRHALRERLGRLGVPSDAIDRELSLLDPLAYAPTRSRSVLGSLNELIFQAKARAAHPLRERWTLTSIEDELGETPMSPLGIRYPIDAALELLGAPGRVLRGPWRLLGAGDRVN
jgi:hypothetical protein